MYLFIDTNIYLNFYHYSNDDLEQLRKLLVSIVNRKANLLLPRQAVDEFKRNREAKIADAVKHLREQKISNQFPQICQGYKEYENLKKVLAIYEKEKSALMDRLTEDISSKTLVADKLTSLLWQFSTVIETSDEVLNAAKARFDVGNPPGKNGSYGDAINWETLLAHVPNGEDLHFVSRDDDFVSAVDKNKLSEFLIDEWTEKKQSTIKYYPSLSDFFTTHFPHIKLAIHMDRSFAVAKLANSASFANTHSAITRLSRYSQFTDQEIIDIADACITNPQVSLIHEDDDVDKFVKLFIKTYSSKIPTEKLEQLEEVYTNKVETDAAEADEGIPF